MITPELVKRSMHIPETWPALDAGTLIECVKINAPGDIVARYPGRVMDQQLPESWLAVEASWDPAIHKRIIDLNGLHFVPGDTLHEFFSSTRPFNCFSVFAPDGRLRGWYANITYPTRIDGNQSPAHLYWHDLYLDIVLLPDGEPVVRDEDEFAASGIPVNNPVFAAEIIAARDDVLALARNRRFPFHER